MVQHLHSYSFISISGKLTPDFLVIFPPRELRRGVTGGTLTRDRQLLPDLHLLGVGRDGQRFGRD